MSDELKAQARIVYPPKTVVVKEVKVPYREYKHEKGDFFCGPGIHEISITTQSQPTKVWVSLDNTGELPVCLGELDTVGVVLTNDGFVVHANVKSTGNTVHWLADLE